MSSTSVMCGNCGSALDEPEGIPSDMRTPCPDCGSKARRFAAHLEGKVIARGGLGIKARHPAERRPFHESYGGPDYSHSRGRHVAKTRVIDREEDIYFEHVEDYETGEVIHHKEEPLSEHRGHGSAKKKSGI